MIEAYIWNALKVQSKTKRYFSHFSTLPGEPEEARSGLANGS
jgi:hypothetical protein